MLTQTEAPMTDSEYAAATRAYAAYRQAAGDLESGPVDFDSLPIVAQKAWVAAARAALHQG